MNERRSLQLLAEKYEQVHAKVSSADPKITTRKLISEQSSILNETELYHATTKDNIESFKAGIDKEKAGKLHGGGGASQGKGFYVFKNKNDAIEQAQMETGWPDHSPGPEAYDFSPIGDTIIVIDRDINSENFDIDYEFEFKFVSKFIANNWNFFLNNWERFHIYNHMSGRQIKPPSVKGVFKIGFGEDWTGTINGNKPIVKADSRNIPEAAILWKFIQEWKIVDPSLFKKFEDEVLNSVDTLKYNGTEKIFPVRIEDLQGNIIWSREPVRS